MRRTFFICVALLLMAPASAKADLAPLPWQGKAVALAQRVWHPACGRLSLAFSDPDAGTLVVNDAPGHEGVVHGAAGFTETGSCAIGINSTFPWRWSGYPVFCTAVLHEAGRSAGMSGTNGRGIMSVDRSPSRDRAIVTRGGKRRTITRWTDVDRRCIRPVDRV